MRRILIIVAAVLVIAGVSFGLLGPYGFAVFSFGLGDDGLNTDDFELMEFTDDPVSEAPPPDTSVTVDFYEIPPELLIEVDYMFAHTIYLRLLARVNEDMKQLTTYQDPGEVDLDWVIEVHEATLEAERIYALLSNIRVPGTNEEVYLDYKLGMLEAVQVSAEGATRLLAASVLIGPSGRSLLNLSVEERVRFDSLLRQAEFYLNEADAFLEDETQRVSEAVGTISLR